MRWLHAFDDLLFTTVVRGYIGRRPLRTVAAEAGVSTGTLSRIANGRPPDLNTFIQLCGVMEIDPREFMYSEPLLLD